MERNGAKIESVVDLSLFKRSSSPYDFDGLCTHDSRRVHSNSLANRKCREGVGLFGVSRAYAMQGGTTKGERDGAKIESIVA